MLPGLWWREFAFDKAAEKVDDVLYGGTFSKDK